MSKWLKALEEKMKDPSFFLFYFEKIKIEEERKMRNCERIKKFYSDEESFGLLIPRIIIKHDDRWRKCCYNKGVMPYPWEILYAVLSIVENEGEIIEDPLDGLTSNFSSDLISYMGFTFAWTYGQGTCLSIYDKNKKLIYRD